MLSLFDGICSEVFLSLISTNRLTSLPVVPRTSQSPAQSAVLDSTLQVGQGVIGLEPSEGSLHFSQPALESGILVARRRMKLGDIAFGLFVSSCSAWILVKASLEFGTLALKLGLLSYSLPYLCKLCIVGQ